MRDGEPRLGEVKVIATCYLAARRSAEERNGESIAHMAHCRCVDVLKQWQMFELCYRVPHC